MARNCNMTLIEDSSGNRYCFTYKDSSIYCKEVTCYGDVKEALLVNQVNNDFIAAIGINDVLYLICCSKTKDILLFIYSGKSWKMSEILYSQSDIVLLNMFIIENTIHILYATKMPLANYHNVYHLYNMHDHWQKINISEIYSEDVHLSFSSNVTDDNYIHFINVWHDGKKYILNNCIYNSYTNTWLSNKLASLMSSNITVELISDNNKLHLFFHALEDDISLLFYFVKKSADSDEFNFISLNKMAVDTAKYIPVYNVYEDNIYMEWINDNIYYKHIFDISLREWKPEIEYTLPLDYDFDLVTLIKNKQGKISKRKIFCTVSNELNIQKPYEDSDEIEEKEQEEIIEPSIEDNLKKSGNVDDLVSYLINQIKTISDDVKKINTKLNTNDRSSSAGKSNQNDDSRKIHKPKQTNYKKSNFKDDFINNKISPTTLKLDSVTYPQSTMTIYAKQANTAESFRDKFMASELTDKSNHIASAVYHGANKNSIAYKSPDITQQNKSNHTPKKEESSNIAAKEENTPKLDLTTSNEKSNLTTVLKKIGDFFKENF